jgi:hypothetical protein
MIRRCAFQIGMTPKQFSYKLIKQQMISLLEFGGLMPNGFHQIRVKAGDANHDGRLDLVVVNDSNQRCGKGRACHLHLRA